MACIHNRRLIKFGYLTRTKTHKPMISWKSKKQLFVAVYNEPKTTLYTKVSKLGGKTQWFLVRHIIHFSNAESMRCGWSICSKCWSFKCKRAFYTRLTQTLEKLVYSMSDTGGITLPAPIASSIVWLQGKPVQVAELNWKGWNTEKIKSHTTLTAAEILQALRITWYVVSLI